MFFPSAARQRLRRLVCWAALLGALTTAVAIFVLSGQPGEESYALTNSVQQALEQTQLDLLTPTMGKYDLYLSVRKWGHIYLYALLGGLSALFALALPRGRAGRWARCGLSAAACLAYSVSDEFHQSFVPGREAALRDVGFDSLGILAGTLAALAFWAAVARLYRRRRRQG